MARLKRGLKRLGTAVLKLVAAYLVVYLIITLYGLVRVEMALARLRRAGEPVALSEMIPPPIPDSENAAVLYAKAFRAIAGDRYRDDEREAYGFWSTWVRKHYPQTAEPARNLVVKYRAALDYAQQASLRPKCRFPVDWSRNPFNQFFPHNSQLRRLSDLAYVAAILAARDGRPDEAARLVALQVRIADSVKDEPTVLARMIRQYLLTTASKTLRKVAAYGGMNARDARMLYDAFSAADIESTFARSVRAERAEMLRIFSALRRHPIATYHGIQSLG